MCQHQFPRPELVKSRIYRGFRGRPSGGHVLMCLPCQVEVEAEYTRVANQQAVIVAFGVIAMVILAVIGITAKG